MTSAVEFTHVSRHYGSASNLVRAVDAVTISIAEGEFFSMLGPSGSGKTTCLRLIAGFEQPTQGSIKIFGQEAAGTPPYEREVNTVFQDYALFPHMNVLENVAYGLQVKGVAKNECISRAEDALNMVALAEYGKRKPSELSGGQRQRVALARALVNKPRVLLLDEPLGALDLKLREQMQHELKTLHKQLGITFIYVTHDQTEALSMSDRVAVFNKGKIEQVDTPRNLYMLPKTSFVADFVGTSNVINSELAMQITGSNQPFSIRPEHVFFDCDTKNPNTLSVNGTVIDAQYQGANNKITVDAGQQKVALVVSSADYNEAELPKIGNNLIVHWLKSNMVMLEVTQADLKVVDFWWEWRSSSPFWPMNVIAKNYFGFGEIDPLRIGIPANITEELERLGEWHDTSLNWDYPPDPSPWRQAECDQFNEKSTALFEQCRVILEPSIKLVYKQVTAMEDPELDRYLADPKNFKR